MTGIAVLLVWFVGLSAVFVVGGEIADDITERFERGAEGDSAVFEGWKGCGNAV